MRQKLQSFTSSESEINKQDKDEKRKKKNKLRWQNEFLDQLVQDGEN